MIINLTKNNNGKTQMFNFKNVWMFYIIFYLVGFLGILFSQSRPFFIRLIPFAIILSLLAILLFHESKINSKLILTLILIYLLGYFIEVIGVNTGVIFGNYQYSSGLGIKIWNTPLFIGLNWVMLIYASAAILNNYQIHLFLKIIFSSLFLVVYDLILEQIAPDMEMWYWKDNRIPLQNYVAWFLIALAFQCVFVLFGNSAKNKMAPIIFSIQTLFFFSLAIYFNFIK